MNAEHGGACGTAVKRSRGLWIGAGGWARGSRLGVLALVGLAALAGARIGGFGIVPGSDHGPEQAATSGAIGDTPTDTAWSTLSLSQQQALATLKPQWSTLAVDRQQKWLLIADRVPRMSLQAQRRVQARMREWAALTPRQQAQARLGYRQAVTRLSASGRDERWRAYQKLPPDQRPRQLADLQPQLVPPSSVKVEPGATTVLLTQLTARPARALHQ